MFPVGKRIASDNNEISGANMPEACPCDTTKGPP